MHAVVARSMFRSQKIENAPGSDHFWKLRCRKSARRCGVKHVSKSKSRRHTRFGPLLEVEMSFLDVQMFLCQVQGIVHLVKSEQKGEGFVKFPKVMVGVGL